MKLALETHWTPDVIGDLPARFRAALHHMLYVEAIVGPNGMPSTEIPKGAPMEVRLAALGRRAEILKLQAELYPEGD